MKRIVGLLAMVAVLFAGSMQAQAVEIKDMSPSHWAYDSVQYLLDNGYLALYDDGTFREDLPVSRVVFAAAMAKLIDQIQSGEITTGGADAKEIQRLSTQFKNEISDYETRMEALDSKLKDLEDSRAITEKDLSSMMVKFNERFDDVEATNRKLSDQLDIVNQDLKGLNAAIEKERKDRKSAQTMMWIGIVAAVAVGVASD